MSDDAAPTADQIDLYWRPGCGFCSMLLRQLDKLGIERVEHNIWDDPEHAAVVRRYANGNETVPTVVIGKVGFVNPTAGDLVSFLSEHHPQLLPDGFEAPQPSATSKLVGKIFG